MQTIGKNDKNISYTVRISGRARNLSVTVFPDGEVVVTLPQRILSGLNRFRNPEKVADEFVERKAQWIKSKIDYFKQREFDISKRSEIDFSPNTNLSIPIFPKRYSPQFKRAKREEARVLVTKRLAHWAKVYGYINTELGRTVAVNSGVSGMPLVYGRISIRSQRTRWGSCSRRGNLNFNWKIALLPPALADYIIVHELCHLIEFNHSRAFWTEVARTLPDYVQLRKQLRAIRLH